MIEARGFNQRKHRAGRSRQTKSGAEANRNRSTTQYGRVNRSVQLPPPPDMDAILVIAKKYQLEIHAP